MLDNCCLTLIVHANACMKIIKIQVFKNQRSQYAGGAPIVSDFHESTHFSKYLVPVLNVVP